jgi:hypothetical protein
MTGQEKIARGYTIRVHQPADAADGYHVFYAPRGLLSSRANGGASREVPADFEGVAHLQSEGVVVRWLNPPKDPEATLEEFEQDLRSRVKTLHGWLDRLWSLVRSVEGWAKELGWATRLLDKSLEDSHIGKYKAPALLMQEGTDRVLLDPLGRSSSGTEGVVDLYLMPAYDDIARLLYYEGRWNLHFMLQGTTVASVRDIPAKPLSKETLQEVLEAMRQNAA